MALRTPFWLSGPALDESLASLLPLRVISLGRQRIPPAGYRVTRAMLRRTGTGFHVLQYGSSGCGYVRVGAGKRQEIPPGHAFFLGDDAPFEYGITGKEPWEIRWVRFDGPWAARFHRRLKAEGPVFPIPPDGDFTARFDRLLEESRGGAGRAEELSLQVQSLMLALVRTRVETEDPRDAFLDRVTRRIRADLAHIDLATLAGDFEISPDHFTRRFEAILGMTPHQYILAQRLEAAARRLESTPARVREVAALVGYPDPSYFGKAFRKRYGMSPEMWRTRFRG